MPHHADDQRYAHLSLIREEHNPERRRRPAPPSPSPQQGKRREFAEEIRHQVDELERQARLRPAPPTGIEPHLVFRIPVAKNTPSTTLIARLGELNISVVAVEADGAIVAFRDDPELARFKDAIARYQRGPSLDAETGEPKRSTKWDILEWIEAEKMRLWGKTDRIGGRLAEKIGTDGGTIDAGTLYVLDIEIWYPENRTEANALLQEVRTLIDDNRADGERLCDYFVGELLCLARVHVRGAKLTRLLELDCIAEIDIPLRPVFNPHAARSATSRDFPTPPRPPIDGPRVCVVDSGIASNHPLLASNVGHAEAILTGTETPADENGHGTMVAGIAVFGDVRASYNAGRFASEVTLLSARVLNKDNRFDDDELILTQMRKAIETFKAPPHNCRVFNISLGEDKPLLTETNSKQGMWAEALDTLAREHQVLFVVSAGNHTRACAQNARDAELVLQSYPRFLMEPECGLCDPATAAIAITVGGIAANFVPAFRLGSGRDDITLPIATANGPTPCTRIGPGINDSMKPEFVADAGNEVFAGMGSDARRITDDSGITVMSLSHVPLERLFSYDVGSSFAAPHVARIAAKLWNGLEQEFDEVHPNFVRAVLGTASVFPDGAYDVFQGEGDEETIRRVYGYGMIDEDFALATGDRRVTLVAQGRMPLDSFHLYEVPVPDEWRHTPGKKHITVALAFDPPVRRRRADYLGVKMDYLLIRGKSIEEIVSAYRQVESDERDTAPGAFASPYKCGLEPGSKSLASSTLQRSSWSFMRPKEDYGDTYYLLVKAKRGWAPATVTEQDYAIAVSMSGDNPELRTLLEQRIRLRQQQRARMRQGR